MHERLGFFGSEHLFEFGDDWSFVYDAAGQLVTANRGAGGGIDDYAYAYDARGNRVSEARGGFVWSFAYNDANQLVSNQLNAYAPTTYAYDAAGRRTTATQGTTSYGYDYDAAGRLDVRRYTTKWWIFTSTWTEDYTYSGDGQLAGLDVTEPNRTVHGYDLTWDNATGEVPQVLAVDDGAGADDFVYGAGRIGVEDADGSTATFSYNPFGSALATAATADWARSASYSPFGQQQNASWADPLAHTPAFGYRSELTLDNTIHLRARTYEPAEGRFTTRDPLDGVAGTTVFTSPYAYANNDPLTFADPLGLSVTDEAMEECAVEAFVHELSFDSDPQFADECIAELLIRQKEEQLNADHTQLVLEQAAALIQAYTETGEVLLSIATGECGPAVVDAVEGTGSTGSAVSGCAKEAAIELAFNGFALAGDLSWVLRHSDEVGDVAEDALPALRQAYFDDFAELSDQVAAWYRAGADPELIAREAWANRRALGMKYKDLTPTDYLEEVVFPRNLERYGDKWGPTWEYTVDHYDSNWEVIIEKSLTPGGFDLGIGPR